MKKYGLGRSRSGSGKGDVIGWHLNPYVNCIHTLVGGVEYYDGFSGRGV